MLSKILKNNDNDELTIGKVKLKTLGIIVSIITTIGGAFGGVIYTLEDRYATKAEVAEIQQETTEAFKQFLIMQYQDELMDLKYKQHQGNITPYEETKIDRIKQRLDQLQDQ